MQALTAARVWLQVESYVRGVVQPLVAASVLDAAAADRVVKKCTAKVVAAHKHAENAAFLAQEEPAIRRMVSGYVDYMAR